MKKATLNDCGMWLASLLIAALMGSIGNFITKGIPFSDSIPALLILVLIGFVGQWLSSVMKLPMPAFIFVMILAMVVALPFSPVSEVVCSTVLKLNMMALVTPILGYAGLTVGLNFRDFMKLSWKVVVVGIVVIFGTWFWSALIAQLLLKATGVI